MKRRYRMTAHRHGMPAWASWSQIVEMTDAEIEATGANSPQYDFTFEPLD